MDAAFFNAPHAVMYYMLFTMIMSVTADQPTTVPAVFQRIWRRYRSFLAVRKMRASQRLGEKFWEIDMTKFEP